MHLHCTKCSARYRIDSLKGEQWQRCAQCQNLSTLAVPDAEQLLDWASDAPWNRLVKFMNNVGTRGHQARNITSKFIQIFNQRRDEEITNQRHQEILSGDRSERTREEQRWDAIEARIRRFRTLDELRELQPSEFEKLVAKVFESKGFKATVVGRVGDRGIDVEIQAQDGSKYGVAQCKKYSADNSVSTQDVLCFGGAYLFSCAEHGFFFTTGELTSGAKEIAEGYKWLSIYSGEQLVEYIENINKLADEASSASIASFQ